ncbi:MAG: hypothetical protein NZL96_04045 [Patescibacteria group bacterium]|nr:hypothetical protein [Patescibacteria group bacterium]
MKLDFKKLLKITFLLLVVFILVEVVFLFFIINKESNKKNKNNKTFTQSSKDSNQNTSRGNQEIYDLYINEKNQVIKEVYNNLRENSKYNNHSIYEDFFITVSKIRKDEDTNAYLVLEYKGKVAWIEDKPDSNEILVALKLDNQKIQFFLFAKDDSQIKNLKENQRIKVFVYFSFNDSSKAIIKEVVKI